METNFTVDPEQIRQLSEEVKSLKDRIEAIKARKNRPKLYLVK